MQNLLNAALESGFSGTFVAALEVTGLSQILNGQGPFTLFVPTDAAFSKLSRSEVEELLVDLTTFTKMLTRHIVTDKLRGNDLSARGVIESSCGNLLQVESEATTLRVNGASIVQSDIECTNGILHLLDSVLFLNSRGKVDA